MLTEEDGVRLAVARLDLLQRCLAAADAVAAVRQACLLQPGPDVLQARAVLRMVGAVAAHTLVLQHQRVVHQARAAALWTERVGSGWGG